MSGKTAAVALVTAARLPDGMEDTTGLLAALRNQGTAADLVVWSDEDVNWSRYDRVFLHAPWDYSERMPEFRQWLSQIDESQLLNSSALLHWNVDKRYLCDLAERGVPIPATCVVDTGTAIDTRHIEVELGTGRLVVKSVVGAGGRRTWLFEDINAVEDFVASGREEGPFLVQRYESAVVETGEFSLIYLGNEFKHAVRKVPAKGEFRVQHHYGGSVYVASNEPWMADFSEKLMDALPGPVHYARIDVVASEESPLLMEVELIEPDLFLRYSKDAYENFARYLGSL